MYGNIQTKQAFSGSLSSHNSQGTHGNHGAIGLRAFRPSEKAVLSTGGANAFRTVVAASAGNGAPGAQDAAIVARCDSALRKNPNLDSVWYRRGSAQMAMGRLTEAMDSFECAMTLSPCPVYASGRDMCAYYLSLGDCTTLGALDITERFLRYSIEFGGLDSRLPGRCEQLFSHRQFLNHLRAELDKPLTREILVKPRTAYFLRCLLAEPHRQEDWKSTVAELVSIFAAKDRTACLAAALQRSTISLLGDAHAQVFASAWLSAWQAIPDQTPELAAAIASLEAVTAAG